MASVIEPSINISSFNEASIALLERMAKRYIWWKTPAQAMQIPARIIAQVMDMGTSEDVSQVIDHVGNDVLRRVIKYSEAGQLSAHSWALWHYRLGLTGVDDELPLMPVRRFEWIVVCLYGEPVGMLQTRSRYEPQLKFRYDRDWLATPDPTPISISLPLQLEAFDEFETRAFFAGLLPEGRKLDRLALMLQMNRRNIYRMLARIGGDCAGAITFRTARQSARWKDKSRVRWLNEPALIAMLKELPGRTMLTGRPGLRLTLAGAQDKLPVVLGPKFQIGLPCHGAPSTHILKTPIAMIEGSVVNEGFCMALAGAMQLNPAPAKIYRVGEHEFLLVTRYDRTNTDPTKRLHQEDFCQALGIDPEAKYQQDGGPDLAQCFNLVRRVTDPSAEGVSRLLYYVIFNVLIGNHDAHGKNFSLLYSNGVVTLAPLYDVLSTAIYPNLTTEMAMKIGGNYRFDELKQQDWNEFSQNAGLDIAQVRKRIAELSMLIPATARRLITGPDAGYTENPIVERIVELIERRSRSNAAANRLRIELCRSTRQFLRHLGPIRARNFYQMLPEEEKDALVHRGRKKYQAVKENSTAEISYFFNIPIQHVAAQIGSVACRSGCSHCCHLRVVAYPFEVVSIYFYLAANLDPEAFAAFKVALADKARTISGMSVHEHLTTNIQCPMLKNNKCIAYPVRPIACAGYHSVSEPACRKSFENPEIESSEEGWGIPMIHEIVEMRIRQDEIAGKVLSAERADAKQYELISALHQIFENPALLQRWRDGRAIFTHQPG